MEILVAKAKAPPPEGQREVLDFVEFLETRLSAKWSDWSRMSSAMHRALTMASSVHSTTAS